MKEFESNIESEEVEGGEPQPEPEPEPEPEKKPVSLELEKIPETHSSPQTESPVPSMFLSHPQIAQQHLLKMLSTPRSRESINGAMAISSERLSKIEWSDKANRSMRLSREDFLTKVKCKTREPHSIETLEPSTYLKKLSLDMKKNLNGHKY